MGNVLAIKPEYRDLSGQEKDTLLRMARSLDANTCRSYGNVIGIVAGEAYVTDGFALLRWIPKDHLGPTRTLKPDLSESAVKFPGVHAVLPKDDGKELPAEVFNSLRRFLKPSWSKSPVWLRILNDEISLVPRAKPTDRNEIFPVLGVGDFFNPALFMKFCAGLPREATCTSATLHKDDVLRVTFESYVGNFELILVGIRKG